MTFADFDVGDPSIGGVLTDAGLEIRLSPKLGPRSPTELAVLLDGVVGAIVSTDPFTREVLAGAPALRVIARTGVGFDTIDLDAATSHGIQVVTTPGANWDAVADHTVGMLLAVLRRIPELDREVRAGGWNRTGAHLPRQLAGSTVGLVGFGGIGRAVAARLAGFGVELLVHDPVLTGADPVVSTPFDELLARCDVVSLHCPLLDDTHHLMNGRTLALMRPGAVLVNTSRGPVVDEAALVDALHSGRLSGAALDVFADEPPRDSPLLTMPNVVVSPHNAGLSTASAAIMCRRCAHAVVEVVGGGVATDPVHLVNRAALAAHPDPSIRTRYLS